MRPLGIRSIGMFGDTGQRDGSATGLFWADTGERIDCIFTNWSISKNMGGPVLLSITVEDDSRVSASNGWLSDVAVHYRSVRIQNGLRYLDLVVELNRGDVECCVVPTVSKEHE